MIIRLLLLSLCLFAHSAFSQVQTLRLKITEFAGYEDMESYSQLDTVFYSYIENKEHNILPTIDEYGVPKYTQEDISNYDEFYRKGENEDMFITESTGVNYSTNGQIDSTVYFDINTGFVTYRTFYNYDEKGRKIRATEQFYYNNQLAWFRKYITEFKYNDTNLEQTIDLSYKYGENTYESMLTTNFTYNEHSLLVYKVRLIDKPEEEQIKFLESNYFYNSFSKLDSIYIEQHQWTSDEKLIKTYKHFYNSNKLKQETWIHLSNVNIPFQLRQKHYYTYNDLDQMILYQRGYVSNNFSKTPVLYYDYNDFGNLSRVSNHPEGATVSDPFTNRYVYEDFILNLEELVDEYFSIFPNPSTNSIRIKTNKSPWKSIEILDMQGKSILIQSTYSEEIDISSLVKGYYLCRLHSENEIRTVAFVKE